MSGQRAFRGIHRTDQQILAHEGDLWLLGEIAARRIRMDAGNRMDLRRLAQDDLILAGFGRGTVPTLQSRGARILAAARGEIALAPDS